MVATESETPHPFQVYTRLNKLGFCLSHAQTLRVIDRLAEGHDQVMQSWKALVEQKVLIESPSQPPPLVHQVQPVARLGITPLSVDIASRSSSESADNEEESVHQPEGKVIMLDNLS